MTAVIIPIREDMPFEGDHQAAAVKALLYDRETAMLLARGYARRAAEHLADDDKRNAAICIEKVRFLLDGGKP